MMNFKKLSIRSVEVLHQPVKKAFGFVFETTQEKAVISGDTKYCPALIEAAKGADILLHEVFIHGEMPVVDGIRTAQTVKNVASYHTIDSEVGIVATKAKVGCLMLTHFAPPIFDRKKLLNTVSKDFKGHVIIGEDLMTFDLKRKRISWKNLELKLGSSI